MSVVKRRQFADGSLGRQEDGGYRFDASIILTTARYLGPMDTFKDISNECRISTSSTFFVLPRPCSQSWWWLHFALFYLNVCGQKLEKEGNIPP